MTAARIGLPAITRTVRPSIAGTPVWYAETGQEFTVTGVTITTASDNGIDVASCDNFPFVTGHDGTIKACYGDGDPVDGHNGDRESIGFLQLGSSYNGGSFTITPIAGGTGISEPTLDGVSGDSTNGARGKCYALMRIGTTYYALVGEQPNWTSNNDNQFENVRLWESTNLIAWTRSGNVDWPLSGAATRGYAWKLPSVAGGANVGGETPDGYFYFISAGETANPGEFDFLSSNDLMLARCPDDSGIETLANWEFLTGVDGSNNPSWSNVFANWNPIPGLSGTTVNHWVNFFDYFSDIDRYVLWRNRRANTAISTSVATALEILEAPKPWGPWTQVELIDPWMPNRATGSNRYLFTWTVPHLWNSAVEIDGSNWTKDIVLAYTGRRVTVDAEFDALMTTEAQLSGTVSGG